MNTKKLLLLLLSFSLVNCSYYQHLEDQSEFTTTEHGSFIRVWEKQNGNFSNTVERRGELIAVDKDSLYMLVYQLEADTVCKGLHRNKVSAFNLYYAKPNTSFWTIPVFTLVTASHGLFAIVTAPLNLLITSLTQGYILRESHSEEGDLNIDELSPYARYPRGIPDGVDKAMIK